MTAELGGPRSLGRALTRRGTEIRELLRQRIASGLHRGSLAPGQRLPSTRRLGSELHATPRTVRAAYAGLAREGLVELRRRSGIYLTDSLPSGTLPAVDDWLVEVLAQGLRREIPPSGLGRRLAGLLAGRTLKAVAIAGNADQADHLCRELRSDYGLETQPVDAEQLDLKGPNGPLLRDADLLVATALAASPARRVALGLRKPLVVVRLRPELMEEMVAALARGPLYFVGTDPRFAEALRVIFAPTGWAHHLRPVILGRDDPAGIPSEAPTYILDLAHARLGDTPLTSRVQPVTRVFSEATARELLRRIAQANLAESS
ncbi:MAG TPA: GntR family transcriptional regulator [Gemmatimonadales bacterium]|nr:GntR family transcriptional regulator [Gemmatimonadales bacterium]